jgi:hypothetical protein
MMVGVEGVRVGVGFWCAAEVAVVDGRETFNVSHGMVEGFPDDVRLHAARTSSIHPPRKMVFGILMSMLLPRTLGERASVSPFTGGKFSCAAAALYFPSCPFPDLTCVFRRFII